MPSDPTTGALLLSQRAITMRRFLFRSLARINKILLPSLWKKDLARLTKAQKILVAWRYWVTRNTLSG